MRKIRTIHNQIFEVGIEYCVSIHHVNNRSPEHPNGYYYVAFEDGHYALVNPEYVVEFWPIPLPDYEQTP